MRQLSKRIIGKICQRLDREYPHTRLHNPRNPLREAIFIFLTSQTTEVNYLETWRRFQSRFPTMRDAARAPVHEIYKAIQFGGLGRWKSKQIKRLLTHVRKRYGRLSLSSCRVLDDQDLEEELIALPGIGIKSARCIMMYSFDRDVFPIDTHVLRIARRLGFRIPRSPQRSKRFADLVQSQVPLGSRARLHVNLVQHGRKVCAPRNPYCQTCMIRPMCVFGNSTEHNAKFFGKVVKTTSREYHK